MKLSLSVVALLLSFLTSTTAKAQFSVSSYGYSDVRVTTSSTKSVTIKLKDESYTSETVISFKKGCSELYQFADGDAPYPSSGPLSLTSLTSDNKSMAFNFLPEVNDLLEVKLNVLAQSFKSTTLSFPELPVNAYRFTLVDTYLNIEKSITNNFSYEFQVDRSIKSSYGTQRFLIRVQSLPKNTGSKFPTSNQELSGMSLAVYPNPSSDYIKFTLGDYRFENVHAQLYTLTGVLIKSADVNENSTIDISSLSPGVYVVMLKRLKSGKEIFWARVIRQ